MSQLGVTSEISSAPGRSFFLITPSSTEFSPPIRAIYVAAGTSIDVVDQLGNAEAGVPVQAGMVLPVALSKITATSVGAAIYGIR